MAWESRNMSSSSQEFWEYGILVMGAVAKNSPYTFKYSHNSHCRKPVRDTHVLPAFSPRSSFHPALSSSNGVHALKILPACLPFAATTCCASALEDRPYLPAASPLSGASTLEDRSCPPAASPALARWMVVPAFFPLLFCCFRHS